jgi:hypothetical protein
MGEPGGHYTEQARQRKKKIAWPHVYVESKQQQNLNRVWWHMSIIPATWEVKIGGSCFSSDVGKKYLDLISEIS